MFRTLINKDDFSANSVGQQINLECDELVRKLLEKYDEYSPYDIANFITRSAHVESARKVIMKRRELQDKARKK